LAPQITPLHPAFEPRDHAGVAGVIGGFFTVVEVAKIISFWPGLRPLRKCCKINGRIGPNFGRFLATLNHDGGDRDLTPIEFALQSTDYKSVGAYRKFSGL
jgi:hypothetical protein